MVVIYSVFRLTELALIIEVIILIRLSFNESPFGFPPFTHDFQRELNEELDRALFFLTVVFQYIVELIYKA